MNSIDAMIPSLTIPRTTRPDQFAASQSVTSTEWEERWQYESRRGDVDGIPAKKPEEGDSCQS